ncbi:potassium transporter [Marinitoga sp. 1135]|uniref:Putative K(+)-stimulated pyrophosphate-energized sodium pump n=1 Tax=Marinitoga piezophila (strain DSM 14283 / JCM 11233 / KA3) TaxID=443254 RepID=H2J4Q9_MARPK|nr:MULTISPECIES: sodium-translocating pyrophosphatase [Marinitoga]AEX84844.1 vacuolar-type H(+)-translocating pyrophosphatase [Marinitoga piezophila KA3]APT75353.1 potassium transporter [Marinitoga sp. 1137]NUU95081.1 potassium transporter [Marinitoga sp. 1135]NUU97035.1 potassium transporter [Marinitoga sp. 1138]
MLLYLLITVPLLALLFAMYNYRSVLKLDEGTERMSEIALAIREGTRTFINHEYTTVGIYIVFISIILAIVTDINTGIAFVIGAIMSGSAGYVGMKMATYANVRVSNSARTTKNIGKTLKVAFQGGSVMGLSVAGFALLGLIIIYIIFGKWQGLLNIENIKVIRNWLGISYIPFAMVISGYALGCSVIAMFDRVGGGIYTKAADMGADLVGKTELALPEDDPRNPATIADNVGDNVGDVAGLGADLLESYIGAIISSVILILYASFILSKNNSIISYETTYKLIVYPVIFAIMGLIGAMLGIFYVIKKKSTDNPHKELNTSLLFSATFTGIFTLIAGYYYLKDLPQNELKLLGFKYGIFSPWLSAMLGIISGIIIGLLAEYYTSDKYKPTQELATFAKGGPAIIISKGMALGMKSVLYPVFMLMFGILLANYFSGLYGVAMAAMGMLSFVAATVSVDSYGPIADNAGGISEMAELDPEVRKITDMLDSVGNTTAAIGKGFAIGSAAFAALSLFASYVYSQINPDMAVDLKTLLNINLISPRTIAGALFGAALPFYFSAYLIDAVVNAAEKMVEEIRRQFREIPGLMEGKNKPDYNKCIKISSEGALKEMKTPALIAVLTPIISGFIFGTEFVGGLLAGTTFSGVMLAIYTANAGGAWDNAKKYIENNNLEGEGKGTEAHKASVVGDTVGDPLKDTVGPSLDILIKIMAVTSLITVSVFKIYHLF